MRSDDDWAAARDWVEREWGGLDVLVNNAGVAGGGRLDVAGLDEWQWITEINLFGVVRGIRTFTPMFKQQRSGQIVNIASLAGLVHPAGMGSYNAVKAGVVALTETAGHELAEYGVRCAAVCPSYFRTGLVEKMQGTRHRGRQGDQRAGRGRPAGARRHRGGRARGPRPGRGADPARRGGAGGVPAQARRPGGVRPADAQAGGADERDRGDAE